jgi:hypothetical protein
MMLLSQVSSENVRTLDLSDHTAGVTQHSVRLALAQEDAANIQREAAEIVHDEISPAMLISAGLDLESQQ